MSVGRQQVQARPLTLPQAWTAPWPQVASRLPTSACTPHCFHLFWPASCHRTWTSLSLSLSSILLHLIFTHHDRDRQELDSLMFSFPGAGQRAQDQCVDFCLALSLTGAVQVSISSGHTMQLSTKVIYQTCGLARWFFWDSIMVPDSSVPEVKAVSWGNSSCPKTRDFGVKLCWSCRAHQA